MVKSIVKIAQQLAAGQDCFAKQYNIVSLYFFVKWYSPIGYCDKYKYVRPSPSTSHCDTETSPQYKQVNNIF